MTHRNGFYGPHVSVYYPGFDQFTQNCETVDPESNDCLTAAKLCRSMSKYYKSESERVVEFVSVLKPYFQGISFAKDCQIGTGNCDLVMKSVQHNFILAILEAKGEVGRGSCDSLSEGTGYTLLSARDRKYTICPAPCYLLELVGCHFFVYG